MRIYGNGKKQACISLFFYGDCLYKGDYQSRYTKKKEKERFASSGYRQSIAGYFVSHGLTKRKAYQEIVASDDEKETLADMWADGMDKYKTRMRI